MNAILAGVHVGAKNIRFGIVLFLLLGVLAGIPLTIDFLGGSLLTGDQYLAWKVVHGYSVFLAFINCFLGLAIDRLEMSRGQKELVSWSFLAAGAIGGLGRASLLLLSALDRFGQAASLFETVLFVLGSFVMVRGLLQGSAHAADEISHVERAHAG